MLKSIRMMADTLALLSWTNFFLVSEITIDGAINPDLVRILRDETVSLPGQKRDIGCSGFKLINGRMKRA